MDTFQQFLEIKKELKKPYNELGLKYDEIAEFIVSNPSKSSLKLVYQTKDGNTESDDTIREDLSNLIGFEVSDRNQTYVVLTRVITKKDLKDVKYATVGELRKIAKTIHPDAAPIFDWVANLMWRSAKDYYTLKYLLMKKGVELPDISILSSVRDSADDEDTSIDWNSSCRYWDYLDGDGGGGLIEGNLPVWCYYIKK